MTSTSGAQYNNNNANSGPSFTEMSFNANSHYPSRTEKNSSLTSSATSNLVTEPVRFSFRTSSDSSRTSIDAVQPSAPFDFSKQGLSPFSFNQIKASLPPDPRSSVSDRKSISEEHSVRSPTQGLPPFSFTQIKPSLPPDPRSSVSDGKPISDEHSVRSPTQRMNDTKPFLFNQQQTVPSNINTPQFSFRQSNSNGGANPSTQNHVPSFQSNQEETVSTQRQSTSFDQSQKQQQSSISANNGNTQHRSLSTISATPKFSPPPPVFFPSEAGNSNYDEKDDTQASPAEDALVRKYVNTTLRDQSGVRVEVERLDPNSPLYSIKSFQDLNLKPELLKGAV
ncbi:unnamed protein product [Didymodactylos carnosus]|uniref:Uncharacterized protein n=1 Tax=Didymodactylos carnosus TaxID=1234261 RepID=A0A814J9C7_9BILA|nr:unnamed protein product [Didymodactylos carnosus]CAF1034955.1 unnamed protein product [Didymodactylos carnosus]CAF3604858.1 unnamed protein product [Didymodactylos carnosus]CAF3805636.1 unnamed protein product [Didymodactylos carnosus]